MKRQQDVSLSELNESDIIFQKVQKNQKRQDTENDSGPKDDPFSNFEIKGFGNDFNIAQNTSEYRANFKQFLDQLGELQDKPLRREQIVSIKVKFTEITFPSVNQIKEVFDRNVQKILQSKKSKKNWNEDDLAILIWVIYKFVELHNLNVDTLSQDHWTGISKLVPGKTPSNCKFRWLQIQIYNVHRDPWCEEEEQILIQLHGQYGTKWQDISKELYLRRESLPEVKFRSSKQCREHFLNHLDPNLKRGGWNKKEDQQLLKLVKEYGKKWAEISKILQNRTENAVKNRYNSLKRSQDKDLSKEDEDNNNNNGNNKGGSDNDDNEVSSPSSSSSSDDDVDDEDEEVYVKARKKQKKPRVIKRKSEPMYSHDYQQQQQQYQQQQQQNHYNNNSNEKENNQGTQQQQRHSNGSVRLTRGSTRKKSELHLIAEVDESTPANRLTTNNTDEIFSNYAQLPQQEISAANTRNAARSPLQYNSHNEDEESEDIFFSGSDFDDKMSVTSINLQNEKSYQYAQQQQPQSQSQQQQNPHQILSSQSSLNNYSLAQHNNNNNNNNTNNSNHLNSLHHKRGSSQSNQFSYSMKVTFVENEQEFQKVAGNDPAWQQGLVNILRRELIVMKLNDPNTKEVEDLNRSVSFTSFINPLIYGINVNHMRDLNIEQSMQKYNAPLNTSEIQPRRNQSQMSIEGDEKISSLSRFLAENYNNTCKRRKSVKNSFTLNISCKSLQNLDGLEQDEPDNVIEKVTSNNNNNSSINNNGNFAQNVYNLNNISNFGNDG